MGCGMNAEQLRILGVIAGLERSGSGAEVDEFSVARACEIFPAALPRHAYVNNPARGQLLRTLTALETEQAIYITKRGLWAMHLTAHGRALLAAPRAEVLKPRLTPKAAAALELPAWEAPRPETVALFPRHDRFYSTVALVVAALGAVIIFAFGQAGLSPFARQSAAAPVPSVVASPTQLTLPVLPTATAVAAAQPGATVTPPAGQTYVVANTGGDGVNLRSQPLLGDPITVLPEGTTLHEIGQSVSTTGTTWLHIRTADGQEGYIQAQFAAPAP
jgi:hypothetical protein